MKLIHIICAFALVIGTCSAQIGRGLEVSDGGGNRVGVACANFTTCATPQITPVGVTRIHVHGNCGSPYTVFWSTGPLICPVIMPLLGRNLLINPQVLGTGTLNLCTIIGPCTGHATFTIPATLSTIFIQASVITGGGQTAWTNRVRIR